MEVEPVSTSSTTAAAPLDKSDARYTFDEARLAALRSSAPWQNDPKYFQSAAFSPSAVMKMLMHCHSGVEKGLKKGGNPIEVRAAAGIVLWGFGWSCMMC